MYLVAPSADYPTRFARHVIVDPNLPESESRRIFNTPGAAVAYLNGQTRSSSLHWFVEVRPDDAAYQADSLIAIPSFSWFYGAPGKRDGSRSEQLNSVARFRPPNGNFSGAFITLAEGSRMSGIAADIFSNTLTGASSVVRCTSTTAYLDNCRLTVAADASTHALYVCEINAGVTLYADNCIFAVVTPSAQRANAAALWAKGPFSIKSCRFHDDDQAGGTGIIYDNASESTIDFSRFGTHPKSQFATDINMVGAGDLWLLYSKWWTTTGANAANAKVQENEV